MKLKLIVALILATAALGAFCVVQYRKTAEQDARVAALSSALEQQKDQVRELRAAKDHLNHQRSDLLEQASAQAKELARLDQVAAPASPPQTSGSASARADGSQSAAGRGGFGKVLSGMMNNPQMKEMLRGQQRMMLDQLYAPLVKKLGLEPEEAAKFKDLMLDKAMKGAESAGSLLSSTGTNRTELLAGLAADQRASDEQIKTFLGDTRYAQLKEYEQTAAERMQLNMFKQQFGGETATISDDQTEQLLAFMQEEKRSLANVGQPVLIGNDDAANVDAMLSEDKSETLLQSQEYVNERVLERAKTVLSPDQLNAFAKFQTNQLGLMRLGMGMARNLFGTEDEQAPAEAAQP